MPKTSVIAIFDVGKTNKKLLLFNEQYKIVLEETTPLTETADEDGFACEDINALTRWLKDAFNKIRADERFSIKAINFSAYGASFVYLDEEGNVILPLYNYLKPYPPQLLKKFYDTYGGESTFAKQTASPVLGNLNSGMQLYRIKQEQPDIFAKIKYALHLPQYLSYVFTHELSSDITSIGCHTNLWHFQNNKYHPWVKQEGVLPKLPAIKKCNETVNIVKTKIAAGTGLHDSSAALIPYLSSFTEPFILLSTGTWCITLNPFNHSQLSDYELHQDCLCYCSYLGKPIKASRLFAGNEHEQQVKRLAAFFKTDIDYYKTVLYDTVLSNKLIHSHASYKPGKDSVMIGMSAFGDRALDGFDNYEHAYHQLMADIIAQQVRSTNLVLTGTGAKRIFVDGGFSRNPIFMHLLAAAYPALEIYAASVAQATALGAALAIHKKWNSQPLPADIIGMQLYTTNNQ